jgi:hypothetical protein
MKSRVRTRDTRELVVILGITGAIVHPIRPKKDSTTAVCSCAATNPAAHPRR